VYIYISLYVYMCVFTVIFVRVCVCDCGCSILSKYLHAWLNMISEISCQADKGWIAYCYSYLIAIHHDSIANIMCNEVWMPTWYYLTTLWVMGIDWGIGLKAVKFEWQLDMHLNDNEVSIDYTICHWDLLEYGFEGNKI